MKSPLLELEGTWEEVMAHAAELAGQRVRLTVIPKLEIDRSSEERISTAESLLKYAGTWAGDDLEESLRKVVATRSPAQF